MRVVMAAGGTAGHIEPALCVADAIAQHDPTAQIVFIGGDRGLERELVPARGYELLMVRAVPFPRRPSAAALDFPARLATSIRQASRHLQRIRPDVVVGFGGYAALPTYIAARRMRIPMVVHEGNAKAGLANRVAARLGARMLQAVPGTFPGAQVVGMPLRPQIANLDRERLRDDARRTLGLTEASRVLLVFGGSQGAVHLNTALADALPALLAGGIEVLHAHGSRNEPVSNAPGYLGRAYLDRMDLAYAAADLAVTRAGAMTCAELAAAGVPAVYVPLPVGNGEQRLNALPVVAAGGGILVPDEQLDGPRLEREVIGLLDDPEALRVMSGAARRHGVRDADKAIADLVMQTARGGS